MGHFYKRDGSPMFEVPKKKGDGMRSTTIKDCRELGLYPSVTTIFQGVLVKPELDKWKQKQVLLAALTLPRVPGETEDEYCERIIRDAFQQVGDAADLGSAVHQAIEDHFNGFRFQPSLRPYVDLVEQWAKDNEVEFLKHEVRLVNSVIGYAGTTDAIALVKGQYTIIDFKTRKTRPEYKIEPWSTEPMQIAAYANCEILGLTDEPLKVTQGCNVYLSTTEPGRIGDAWYDVEKLDKEFDCFTHICKVYQHLNRWTPPAI